MRTKTDKRQIEYVQVSLLTPYARNSRTHTAQQVKQIAASIKEFGFTNPVLIDKDNGIIAGHGRVLAAEHLAIETVPCIRLDYLTETQRKAYVIADNKIALNATWDFEMLKLDLADISKTDIDLDSIGFTQLEVNNFLSDYDAPFELSNLEDKEATLDAEPKQSDVGYTQFSIVLSTDDKKTLLDKIAEVRSKYSLDSMAESLMTIIKSYA